MRVCRHRYECQTKIIAIPEREKDQLNIMISDVPFSLQGWISLFKAKTLDYTVLL